MNYSDSEIDEFYDKYSKKLEETGCGTKAAIEALIEMWESPQLLQLFTETETQKTCQLMVEKLKRLTFE